MDSHSQEYSAGERNSGQPFSGRTLFTHCLHKQFTQLNQTLLAICTKKPTQITQPQEIADSPNALLERDNRLQAVPSRFPFLSRRFEIDFHNF